MSRRGPLGRPVCTFTAITALCLIPVLSCAEPEEAIPPMGAPAQLTTPPADSPPAVPAVSVFTGLPTDTTAPVVAVKIDNAAPARPQSGLAAADLMYVEPVEGGISRFLAVYQSQLPEVVGPVRSVRESDLQLLANFGRPALAFSGEAPPLRPLIDMAPILDVSVEARPEAYFREWSRPSPHNLFADPAALRTGGEPARDIGFRFGPAPSGGEPMTETTVGYTATAIGLQWSAEQSRWLMTIDGAPLTDASGERPSAATVVLQRVQVRVTPIRDVTGAPSPFAVTVGSGEAVVLRDGKAFTGTWTRSDPQQATTFSLPGGAPLPFAPGPVWMVLIPA